jgi:hypothetical protein
MIRVPEIMISAQALKEIIPARMRVDTFVKLSFIPVIELP